MFGRCVLLVVVAAAISGCESGFRNIKLPGFSSQAEVAAETRSAAKQRDRFQESQSSEAIRWLLSKRISNGMTLSEVDHVIGQDGQRRWNDAQFKSRNAGVIATDESWEWGPDEKGMSYILFFRNDRLVNFEPSLYDNAGEELMFQ